MHNQKNKTMKKINLFALGLIAFALTSCAGESAEDAEIGNEDEQAQEYTYEDKESIVKWAGIYIKNGAYDHDHTGFISISSGSVFVVNGAIISGQFEVDLKSIDERDATMGEESRVKLVGHLKSEDFFDVANSPTATIRLQRCTPNLIQGVLFLKGVEMPFESPGEFEILEAGNLVRISGELDMDFTKFAMPGFGEEGESEYVSPMVKIGYSVIMRKKA